MPKIWKRIVNRILDLKSQELKENNIFKGLSQEAVMFFCNLCEIKIYNQESADMSTGGILFYGNGFGPDGESEDDDLGLLKFIAPGSGSYSSQQEGNCVVMHFP